MDIPDFDPEQLIVLDIECISFDDTKKAIYVKHDSRISGVAIYQPHNGLSAYIQLRHRTEKVPDAENNLKWLQRFIPKVKHFANANNKFDMWGLAQDGCFFDRYACKMYDVLDIARHYNCDELEYNLEYLTKKYVPHCAKEGDAVKDWCVQNKTQDFGRVPLPIISKYAIQDCKSTYELLCFYTTQMDKEQFDNYLAGDSVYLSIAFDMEYAGTKVDRGYLARENLVRLNKIITIERELQRLVHPDFNAASPLQIKAYFESNGFKSKYKGKKKKDGTKGLSYGAKFLDDMIAFNDIATDGPYRVAKLLREHSEESVAEASFCQGWLNASKTDGKVHTSVRVTGCATGRQSQCEPTLHNFPDWTYKALLIPDGYVGIKFDYSQKEYRVFNHYANNPLVIDAYNKNPDLDYHTYMAELLGVPRDPVKTMNFAILYGIGDDSLILSLGGTIRKIMSISVSEERRVKTAKALSDLAGFTVPIINEDMTDKMLQNISISVKSKFLKENPAIERLKGNIRAALSTRGYIKNFYGRRYHAQMRMAYKLLNYLIQGTCADFFKRKIVEIFTSEFAMMHNITGRNMTTNVHDSVFSVVPISIADEWVVVLDKIATESPFRIPLKVDFEVALHNWDNCIKLGNTISHTLSDGKKYTLKSSSIPSLAIGALS